MDAPLHLGLEHPNLLWIVAVGILAFAGGLAVNIARSRRASPAETVDDPDAE